MARELGMNPRKLGKIDNHKQEPWKAPLPQFIEHLYFKKFGRERPEVVISVEEWVRAQRAKRAARKEAKRRARAAEGNRNPGGEHEPIPVLRVSGHRPPVDGNTDQGTALLLDARSDHADDLRKRVFMG
jgi:hypothetical protein